MINRPVIFRAFLLSIFVFLLAAILAGGPAVAQPSLTLTVDADSGTVFTGEICPTPRDGATYTHPQAAVNCAEPGDAIDVYPGTYPSHYYDTIPPHYSDNDRYAPPLMIWQDNLALTALDGSGVPGDGDGDVIIELTHDIWSNPVAVQAATGGVWDGSRYVGAGIYPDGGIAPYAVDIVASEVLFEGFTVHNGVPGDIVNHAIFVGGLHAGDLQFVNRPVARNIVRDNWVVDSGFQDGIWIWQSDGNLVAENVVPNPVALGIRIFDGDGALSTLINLSDHTTIRDNITNHIHVSGHFSGNSAIHKQTAIEGNEVQKISLRSGRYDGVTITNNIVHDEITCSGGQYTDLLIRGNEITPLPPVPGVHVRNATAVVVEDNDFLNGNVDGLKLENVAGQVNVVGNTFVNMAGVKIHLDNVANATVSDNQVWQSTGQAVRLDGSTRATISDNYFEVDDFGLWVAGNSGGMSHVVHNVFDTPLGVAVLPGAEVRHLRVNYNDFGAAHAVGDPDTTDAIYNDPANQILDAECNWYGTLQEDEILDHLTGPIDYRPWLTSATLDNCYPPEDAFVTGGGWIDVEDGKGTFNFVSKYQKGAEVPTGNAGFRTPDFTFRSERQDALFIGAGHAYFGGEGRVNSETAPDGELYKYTIWAGDNAGAEGQGTFRIRIWWEAEGAEIIVYDNGVEQVLGGGSITIHEHPG